MENQSRWRPASSLSHTSQSDDWRPLVSQLVGWSVGWLDEVEARHSSPRLTTFYRKRAGEPGAPAAPASGTGRQRHRPTQWEAAVRPALRTTCYSRYYSLQQKCRVGCVVTCSLSVVLFCYWWKCAIQSIPTSIENDDGAELCRPSCKEVTLTTRILIAVLTNDSALYAPRGIQDYLE